jgi:hypothetical protein
MNDDRAILVGLSTYTGLETNLKGPANDVEDFYEWLTTPPAKGGGGVHAKNVTKIVSADFPGPFASVDAAQPTVREVQRAFTKINSISLANEKAGNGRRVGRRLYLYFAGHGIAPSSSLDDVADEAALLMADAEPGRFGEHIAGRRWARWFHRAALFDELVLLMDCCRDVNTNIPAVPPHLDDALDAKRMKKVRLFLGFGTKWASKSRERPMAEFKGKDRGVFTVTLMKGLRGAAADPSGDVTSASLKSYLINSMKDNFAPEDLLNPDIEKEPDVDVPARDFTITTVPVPKFPVRVNLSPAVAGRQLELVDGALRRVDQTIATPPAWELKLTRGLYRVRVVGGNGANADIEAGSTGGVLNVNL